MLESTHPTLVYRSVFTHTDYYECVNAKKLFEMHKKALDFLVNLSYYGQAVAGATGQEKI